MTNERITMDQSDGIQTVDTAAFDRIVVQSGGRIAVEFMSYGCGFCRTIEPIIQRVAAIIATNETVLQVNVAAEPDLASRYGIAGTPTFVMFLDGTEVGRTEGPDPTESAITEAITGPFLS
jgi:thioredoxin 1